MRYCAICTGKRYKQLEGIAITVSRVQVYTCDDCERKFRYLGLYNPRDIWHRPYFIITDTEVIRNDRGRYACALTEKDYLAMCKVKGEEPYRAYPFYVYFRRPP